MRKMGYIVGTGLGKLADGRIEPVTAVVLPAGKSLGVRLAFLQIVWVIASFFRSLHGSS